MDFHKYLSPKSHVGQTWTWLDHSWSDTSPRIYSAGGTILSASNYSRLDNVAYGSGVAPTPHELLGNASEILSIAQIAIVKFPTSGGSAGLNSSLYLNISQHANTQLCAKGSDIAGAIMFHGTNTLAETVSILFWLSVICLIPRLMMSCNVVDTLNCLNRVNGCSIGFRGWSHLQLFQTIRSNRFHAPKQLYLTRWTVKLLPSRCSSCFPVF